MSHLVCKTHKRRVLVSEGKAIHRSTLAGDLTASCGSLIVISDAALYSVLSPVFHAKSADAPGIALLKEIYEGGEES